MSNIFLVMIFMAYMSMSSLNINLIRHAYKSDESPFKSILSENFKWELSNDGLKNAENLGVHFYYKYKNNKSTPLIYTSPFRRCIQTALPIAKALNTKVRIEYGLYEPFHGFPTEEEIKTFYEGNEDYIDEAYKSDQHYDISSFFKGDMLETTIAPSDPKTREAVYQNQRKMADYLSEVQDTQRVDIIVVSHQQEMNEIGFFLQDPKRMTRNNGADLYTTVDHNLMTHKWSYGRIVEFTKNVTKHCFSVSPRKYVENKHVYYRHNNYGLTTEQVENFRTIENVYRLITTGTSYIDSEEEERKGITKKNFRYGNQEVSAENFKTLHLSEEKERKSYTKENFRYGDQEVRRSINYKV